MSKYHFFSKFCLNMLVLVLYNLLDLYKIRIVGQEDP